MITDAKTKDFDVTGELKTEVSFLEFVELYVNYRPAHGISLEDLDHVYATFCEYADPSAFSEIDRESFINTLCEKGNNYEGKYFLRNLVY